MRKILMSFLAALGINFGAKAQTDKLQIGLKKTIDLISKLETKNHTYLVNLIKDNTVLFQIIHGALIEQTRTETNEFNYSINLTFGEEQEKRKKFEKLSMSQDFKYYEWNSIPCYAINLNHDRTRLIEYVIEIIEKVYGYDRNEIFGFEIFDQGPVHLAIPN